MSSIKDSNLNYKKQIQPSQSQPGMLASESFSALGKKCRFWGSAPEPANQNLGEVRTVNLNF